MASSLKMTDLPTASVVNSSDIFLLGDVDTSLTKKLTFEILNSSLSAQSLSGYHIIQDDIDNLNETVTELIGDNGFGLSMGGLSDSITATNDLITSVHRSLVNQVDQIRDAVDVEVANRGRVAASVTERMQTLEDSQLRAGLASGLIYVKTFQGG